MVYDKWEALDRPAVVTLCRDDLSVDREKRSISGGVKHWVDQNFDFEQLHRLADTPSPYFAGRPPSVDQGASICFSGIVRAREGNETIAAIDYEAFPTMVEHQFSLLFDQLEQRWPVASVRLVHRTGRVPAGEPSLWVEVVAPHRGEAFAACQWLIDEMKRVVPIWKHPVAANS
jgi:molybdopterin synthase catalytic subunit